MKVLLTTDFTEAATHANKYALTLLEDWSEPVEFTLAHGFKSMAPYVETSAIPVVSNQAWEDESGEKLHQQAEELKKFSGKEISGTIKKGSILELIKQLPEEEQPELVVMASRNKSLYQKVTFGSNTLQVAGGANCSVLVVPPEARIGKPHKITFAADFQPLEIPYESFELLKSLVAELETGLDVLHVYESEDEQKKQPIDDSAIHRYLEDIKHEHTAMVNENVYEGLSSFVEDKKPDLLAMVLRERGFFEELFHSSITRKMAHHTMIPLLILK